MEPHRDPTPQSAALDGDAEVPFLTLRLSVEDGRWLVTALGVALRLLEGLHINGAEAQRLQVHGLAALHRVANRLPNGLSAYDLSSTERQDER